MRTTTTALTLSLAAALPSALATVTEHVALGPGMGSAMTSLGFATVTYPSGHSATSASDVTIEAADDSLDALGAWEDLELDGYLALTGRVSGDNYYAYMNTGRAPNSNGCCADTMRVFGKDDDGAYSDLEIDAIVTEVFANISVSYAYATHMFDMTKIAGATVAMMVVQYKEPELNDALCDAVVALNVETGEVVPTADGDELFSYYRSLGTTSATASDGIYSIYHSSASTEHDALLKRASASELIAAIEANHTLAQSVEEYHQNGLTRFTAADDTTILASTHRSANTEARLLKCPWRYTTAEGGGSILQRFGSPGVHTFGLTSKTGSFTAMHNIWYHATAAGDETLTVFVNTQTGEQHCMVYEFGLNLVAEADAGDEYDDTVFETTYQSVETDFSTGSQGGARPIGTGVYLVATGSAKLGLKALDLDGGQTFYEWEASIYDPFSQVIEA
mmetsp:Transcript_94615/g.270780  ORF Transcript_94615/g.270780 Transcript_94615/m.270780 type:complete len:449 (+) Transcript_94615:52-1398(+)